MFQTKVVDEIKTNILCSVIFFYAVYEIMWKSIVEWGGPQMTVWCMCIACWITKATHAYVCVRARTHTHTHTLSLSQYVILIAFPLQQWLQECVSLL